MEVGALLNDAYKEYEVQCILVDIRTHVHVCLVCLTLRASFFLPSHLSFKNIYIINCCTPIE